VVSVPADENCNHPVQLLCPDVIYGL
jgi:hypothetical protein